MKIPKDKILQLLRDRSDHDTAQQADQPAILKTTERPD
jgi:hypothetical protein